jgi:hypothetical protein
LFLQERHYADDSFKKIKLLDANLTARLTLHKEKRRAASGAAL